MSNTDDSAAPTGANAAIGLPGGPFVGPIAFAQLIRDALACASRQGWGEMVWSDADFADWPLRERAVVESLNDWSRSGRRLLLLAHSFDSMQRYQARFVTWRVQWDHIVECRVCKHLDASEVPSVFWTPQWFMRRIDVVRSNGVSSLEAQQRVLVREELEECRRQGVPGFPASRLGL